MDRLRRDLVTGRLVEALLLLVILAGLAHCFGFFVDQGYLPPPFVYNPNDTFMDWYNSAYWAVNGGAYESWGSIYPPLSFVFLKIFTIHSCYEGDSLSGRDCDWFGRTLLVVIFLANIPLVFAAFRRVDRKTALLRTAALCLGLPMVFTLERGNLILPCFTCFVLAFGRVLRSARLRWIAAALAVNFKPYLAVALLPYLLRRRWRWLEGAALATVLIYIITWAIIGSGSPFELLADMAGYVSGGGNSYFGALWYGGSYVSILNYLEFGVPLIRFVGSQPLEILEVLLPGLIRFGQASALIALSLAAFSRRPVPVHRLGALCLALAISSTEFGGYAEVFLLFLVFHEPWRGFWRIAALLCAYLLSVPVDWTIAPLARHAEPSWLSNQTVGNVIGITLGLLIRPGLVLVIQYALTIDVLKDILRTRHKSDQLIQITNNQSFKPELD